MSDGTSQVHDPLEACRKERNEGGRGVAEEEIEHEAGIPQVTKSNPRNDEGQLDPSAVRKPATRATAGVPIQGRPLAGLLASNGVHVQRVMS